MGDALQELTMLMSICINKLKDFGLVQRENLDNTINTIFKLFNFKCCCKKSNQKFYNNLWQSLIRTIDVLFIYEKENFVKSNYEMRLKAKIYDQQEKRFRWTFNFTDLESWIEPDMYENPGVLINTILYLFEGFNEDQASLK